MKHIVILADASNWSEVTNVNNYGATFEAPNGFKFALVKHKKAHYLWSGERKEGAIAEVCYKLPNTKKEICITTPKLKELCGVAKSQKGERKPRKSDKELLTEVFAKLVNRELAKTLQEEVIKFEERAKAKEEADAKAKEELLKTLTPEQKRLLGL